MNYPDDAKLLALATAFHALVVSLNDSGALSAERFLGHIAAAHRRLGETDGPVVAAALQDLVEPIAKHLGYASSRSD